MSEKRIVFLSPLNAPNSTAVAMPLKLYRRGLLERGCAVEVVTALDGAPACDVLIVDSKWYRSAWNAEPEQALAYLEQARKNAGRIVWYDTTDSTGTTQFEVLSAVDAYWKCQTLRDRKQYLRSWYGNRIFADAIHEQCGIEDEETVTPGVLPVEADLGKIRAAWSSALGDWGEYAPLWSRVRNATKLFLRFRAPVRLLGESRTTDLTCRISKTYGRRDCISYYRRRAAELLESRYGVSTDRVTRKAYYRELRKARVAVSPFGWGEIAYRDFEIFLAGAVLLKPSMTHLETWPDLYLSEETYMPYQWDFSDFTDRVDRLLSADRWKVIAAAGRERYAAFLWGREACDRFCERVAGLIGELCG